MDTELLELLLSVDYKKFITGLIITVVMPPLLTTITSILKNKSLSKLVKSIDHLHDEISEQRYKIDDMYRSNFSESTKDQIAVAFNLRVEHDIKHIVKGVKRLIHVNHIDEDKDRTRDKIVTITSNVHNRSKSKLSCFHHKGKGIDNYYDCEWIKMTSDTIEDFVYNSRIYNDDNSCTYNYDVLLVRLQSNFDTISNEFFNNINV